MPWHPIHKQCDPYIVLNPKQTYTLIIADQWLLEVLQKIQIYHLRLMIETQMIFHCKEKNYSFNFCLRLNDYNQELSLYKNSFRVNNRNISESSTILSCEKGNSYWENSKCNTHVLIFFTLFFAKIHLLQGGTLNSFLWHSLPYFYVHFKFLFMAIFSFLPCSVGWIYEFTT